MLDVSVEGHVVLLTLDRPQAKNAVNGEVARDLEAAIDRLEDDESLWVGILTHTGDVFSAGADLKAIRAGRAAELTTERGGFGGFVRRVRAKPVIVAAEGPALAGGCELALAADLVVASTNARFGLPEVKRSLVAAGGGLFRLPRALPRNVAMEMILTGEPISAERAHHFGLVNRLTEPGEALDEARALAGLITANAPVAVRESRRVVVASATERDEDLWDMSLASMAAAMSSEDLTDGLAAFLEKRPPKWTGR